MLIPSSIGEKLKLRPLGFCDIIMSVIPKRSKFLKQRPRTLKTIVGPIGKPSKNYLHKVKFQIQLSALNMRRRISNADERPSDEKNKGQTTELATFC